MRSETHTHLQSYLERSFTLPSIYLCHLLFKTFNLDLTFKFSLLFFNDKAITK